MIRIVLGNVGSGKTAVCVREMFNDISGKTTFSNIITKGIKNNILLRKDMIINKEIESISKTGKTFYKYSVNKDFWVEALKKYGSLNIIIDEAHTILNSRNAMSKEQKIILEWVAMIRRVLGGKDSSYGTLTLISQLDRRLDVVIREMATKVTYLKCHFINRCQRCRYAVPDNNENPEVMTICPVCNCNRVKRENFKIEVWNFQTPDMFMLWKYFGKRKMYYSHDVINDISEYFPHYNTLQWENLISD